MKKLHLFVVKSFIGPFVLTFFIALFVLLMQFVWKYIDDLVGKGLEWTIIAELLMYAAMTLVPMALPLALLLASLMTFGNLGENYELVAIKSLGISLQRIMSPLIVLTIAISIGAFYFANYALPYANLKTGALLYDISHQRPELSLKVGVFNNNIEGFNIRINSKNRKTDMFYNIMIYDHKQSRGNTNVTLADSGTIKVTKDKRYMVITLYNGTRYEEVDENQLKMQKEGKKFPYRRDKFQKQSSTIELSGFKFNRTDEDLFRNNFQMLNIKQLVKAEDSLNQVYNQVKRDFASFHINSNYFKADLQKVNYLDTAMRKILVDKAVVKSDVLLDIDTIYKSKSALNKKRSLDVAANYARYAQKNISNTKMDMIGRMKWIKRHQIEWHRKFALSFACFIFFFIGAPLGAIIRKGGLGMPVVISVVFFIAYYVISLTGEKFVREDMIPAYMGIWFSSFVLFPLGMFLTYKATHDSVILDIDTYLSFYKNLFLKLKNRFNSKRS